MTLISHYPTKTMSIDTKTQKTVIEVYIDVKHGSRYTYVKDEKQREAIQTLTGKKTVDRFAMRALESLGFEFTLVMNPHLSLNTAFAG